MFREDIEEAYQALKSEIMGAIAEELEGSLPAYKAYDESDGFVELDDVKLLTENCYPELDQDYMAQVATRVALNDEGNIIVHLQDYMKEWDCNIADLTLSDVLKIYEAM